jgi:AAA15 family ATPase/GTPase
MVMNIKVKNLGALRQAEFNLGELTIICGGNNTGKTYATYALFGFLDTWQQFFSISIDDKIIKELLDDGVIHLDIQKYVEQSEVIVSQACQNYTQQLPRIFASQPDRFKESRFEVSLDTKNMYFTNKFEQRMRASSTEIFSIKKNEDSTDLVVTLLADTDKVRIPSEILASIIADAIKEIIFSEVLPKPFIASTERTGVAMFRRDLNFARNRLLDEMSQAGKDSNPMELLFKVYQDYPSPVEKNVSFTRELETIFKKRSFIFENHPDILADFADIIGGEYTVSRDNELYYMPKNGKKVRLAMDESSSAVRSLLIIGFYLRHEAQLGDLLMVDEPELNLHPENQRRIARLFARLVNLGVKVFITTHSDYLIKELNTLIMLNHNKPHLKQIAEDEGYRSEELLSSDKIKVYIAEEASVKPDGKERKIKCQTLIPAAIDPELGIEARSFDKTIEEMNRIQEAIVWGES